MLRNAFVRQKHDEMIWSFFDLIRARGNSGSSMIFCKKNDVRTVAKIDLRVLDFYVYSTRTMMGSFISLNITFNRVHFILIDQFNIILADACVIISKAIILALCSLVFSLYYSLGSCQNVLYFIIISFLLGHMRSISKLDYGDLISNPLGTIKM